MSSTAPSREEGVGGRLNYCTTAALRTTFANKSNDLEILQLNWLSLWTSKFCLLQPTTYKQIER
eukprot:scaffold26160_cov39-Tisochrysis_lutea.AAC.5